MADLSVTPIGTQVKPMPGMSLGEILAAARSAQEYRQAKEINPLLVERAETELKRLKGLMPEELSKAQSEAEVARETVASRIAASKSTADTAASQAQEARLKVFQSYLANTRMEAADLLKQPEITYNDVVNKFTQSVNNATDDEALRKQILAQGLQGIPKDLSSDQYRAFLANSLVKTVNTETQLATRFPSVSLVSTGAKTGVPITTGGAMAVQQPGQVGTGGVSMEVAPISAGQRFTATGRLDATGQHEIYAVRDAQGNVIGEVSAKDIPAAQLQQMQTQGGGGLATPLRPPPGETPETFKVYQQETMGAREGVNAAQTALNNITTIRRYLPAAQTGSYSELINAIKSLGGNVAGSKPEEISAAARDIVQKNLEDLAILKNASLGGKFASSLEAAKNSLATVEKNPTAILKSIDQVERLMQHRIDYSKGLDLAISNNPQNYYIKPKFDQAVNESFDLDALQMRNAYIKNGKEGVKKWVKENGINIKQQEKLADKLDRYDAVMNGDLDYYNQLLKQHRQPSGKK